MDDICVTAGVSRATVYRLFPGGRDVLFEAVRLGKLEDFFTAMRAHVEGSESLEDLLVRCIVVASSELQLDEHLAMMLSTEEGTALKSLTVEGLPRILNVASQYMTPFLTEFVPNEEAELIVELLARFVISFFLAPSQHFDLGDPDSARSFFAPFIYAFHPAVI